MDFSASSCPLCGVTFSEESDVVVCPVCGTPHHRDCYTANGGCANTALHGDGFVYSPAPGMREQSLPAEQKDEAREPEQQSAGGFFNPVFYEAAPDENTMCGDISYGEYADCLGRDAIVYFPRFKRIHDLGRVISVSLTAFLFPFTWAASKKMYRAALVLLITGIAFTGINMYDTASRQPFRDFFAEFSEMMSDNILTEAEAERFNTGYELFLEQMAESAPSNKALSFLTNLGIADNFIFGLYAVYLYKKDADRRIVKKRRAVSSGEPYEEKFYYRMPLIVILAGYAVRAFAAMGLLTLFLA